MEAIGVIIGVILVALVMGVAVIRRYRLHLPTQRSFDF